MTTQSLPLFPENQDSAAGSATSPQGAGRSADLGAASKDNDTYLNVPKTMHFRGPDPWLDLVSFGARVIAPASIPTATATCRSGSTIIVLSDASTFRNGDGITIQNCGATNTLSTPIAPSVAPAVAIAGTGTGAYVTGPAGSTRYCYKVRARTTGQGVTAASPATCITTGQSSLGAQTLSISVLSKSENVVIVTTSASHNFKAGEMVRIIGTNDDNDFAGWFLVASTPTHTTFTYKTGQDARAGGLSSASGGTATGWNLNHVAVPPVAGAVQYGVYFSSSGITGSFNLIGLSRPQNSVASITDPTFDDYGEAMTSSGLVAPSFWPRTDTPGATNNSLTTTTISGAGTTTIRVADTATQSASGTAIFDDGPALIAAGSGVYIPAGCCIVINSWTIITTGQFAVLANPFSEVYLNDTLQLPTGGVNWYGDALPPNPNFGQFGMNAGALVQVGTANPGIAMLGGGGWLVMHGVNLGPPSGNAISLIADSLASADIDRVNAISGGLTGMGIEFRNADFSLFLNHITLGNSQSGNYATPGFFCNRCGNTVVTDINSSGAGILFNGDWIHIKGGRIQGSTMPFLTLAPFGLSPPGGVGTIGFTGPIEVEDYELDTATGPLVANLSPNQGGVSHNYIYIKGGLPIVSGGGEGRGVTPQVTGIPTSTYNSNQYLGNETFLASGCYGGVGSTNGHPVYGTCQTQGQQQAQKLYRENVDISAKNGLSFDYTIPVPTVSKTTGCGGSSPRAGTYYYQLSVIGADSIESPLSTMSNSVTLDGTSNCAALSWSDVVGAQGYKIYVNFDKQPNNGQQLFAGGCNSLNRAIRANNCIDNQGIGSGNGSSLNGTGPISIYPTVGLSTFQINFGSASPSGSKYGINIVSGNFTGQRNTTLPDGNSSTVLAQSFTTSSASSDIVTVQGVTASSHCGLTATNAAAATNVTAAYISAVHANTVTVVHATISGMAYNLLCTPN